MSQESMSSLKSYQILPNSWHRDNNACADVRQAPSQASPTILKPIHRPGVQPGHLLDLEARQTDGKTGTPVILKPIPRPQVLKTGLATSLQARQEALVPAKKIILGYAAAGMAALVDVAMKQPAVALEEVAGITSVKCTSAAVSMKFSNAAAVKAASTAWPKSNFIIITYSPDGGCNTADERGFYTVSALKFDEASLTATASAVRSALDKQSEDAVVEFDTTTAPAKRDFQSSIGGEINGTLVDTKNLKIVVDKAKYESNIRIKGGFRFNFLKFKPSKMYLDVDYSGLVNLNISTTVAASFSSKLYNYEPLSASVSAFSIPGILDVGPIAQFALGVEFAASGTVNATLGLQSEIVNGQVHLDLLDSNKSSTSGWKPKTTVSSDVSAEVSLQLNPYLDLNLALGIRVFKGVIDLTTGFEVKPQVINAFSADLDFAYASTSGITFTKPAAATCPNGAWFASTFNMDVIAYVGTLYSKTLFNVNAPIFQSKCWNFAG
ncbi:hypothetical protein COCMIDRAFT_40603 [Bipolaris oryzae ATCC 44560]|uniref:DUF7029 domain-containing protein n=1 Tax=Bipolaris oryzae ATCC 44560 TaxID=930090 RepID=W6YPB8_COCMI|nr:uncharacterized protein COCMIDRAFT_40603 [Bipolaris oryzae ATCC 44560]EUC41202.1 hypothetical protein COCMIDRAFT_40603 [Bipolaris oryzae ATCC 44560]